eukprot:gnl/TRDRNA2_/TRDRNA2_131507_c0_seq1.p2 gnl/TRDRNA2_/TRDRNA2_131507_c0~~gnl/TRDRNA2_/TRDRNA2_131507_c0_seq1.p2  ORF type:complete len:322 (-),score=73.50 gnl/TRDRNA2_/TRDRNA2_131507_c0_seq1:19-870(-)
MTAQAGASQWLRAHGNNPNNDQLAELKTENPEAYAIVKALLVKQSMGLLNMRHPSASWSAPPPQDQEAAPSGANAYAKFASPGELKKSQPEDPYPAASTQMYSEVGQATHVDNWNWSTKHSSEDDDAMVSQVLGAVAELKGKKSLISQKSQTSQQSEDLSPLAAHDADFGVDTSAPSTQPAAAAEAAPEPKPVKQENSYLKGLDLNADDSAPAQSVEQQPQESAPAKVVSLAKESDSVSPLSSFSFDDSDTAPQQKPKPAPVQPVQQQLSTSSDALSKFLGMR